MDYTKAIREYIDLEKEVISKLDVDAINDAMNLIMKAYEANKKIYIFGNGGVLQRLLIIRMILIKEFLNMWKRNLILPA